VDLRIIKQRLDEAPLDSSRLRIEGNTLKNIPAFRSLVETLADVPPLKPLADVLRKSGIYQIGAEAAGFAGDQAREIAGLADEFYLTARGLKKALETLVVDVPQETVVASIPKQKDDLTSVVAVLSDLHKALAQLVSETGIGGEVRVERWETGSLLVFLFLGTLSAVGLVARTLRAAAIAYQEIQKGRLLGQHVEVLKEHVKGEKIRNDMAETFRSAQEERIRSVVDREGRAVDAEYFQERDNERAERIKNSIRILADLLDGGTTIYPALEMPEEKRKEFPDMQQLLTSLSAIKPIEEGSSSSAAEKPSA